MNVPGDAQYVHMLRHDCGNNSCSSAIDSTRYPTLMTPPSMQAGVQGRAPDVGAAEQVPDQSDVQQQSQGDATRSAPRR